MQITISTKTHYEESNRKGVGHDANVPPDVALKWKNILEGYEKIRLEMESYYKAAYDNYFSDMDGAARGAPPQKEKPRKKKKIR